MSRPQRISFENQQGQRISAILDLPDGEVRAQALFAHCFTCTKDLKAAHWIGQTLAASGIAMLRFDFAGLGESEGEFSESSLSTNIADLSAAAAFLAAEHEAPALLLGHSLGGAAVLAAAGEIPSARAVATISAPFDPAHLRRYLLPPAGADVAPERMEIRIAGRRFQLGRQFLEDLERYDMSERVGSLGRALLIFHSPEDAVVEVEQAGRIFRAARHPRSFIALDGADHLLTNRWDAELVGRMLAVWIGRYLD
jgi:putative redox protein